MAARRGYSYRDCAVPSVWCGKGAVPKGVRPSKDGPPYQYTRRGTPTECLKKGVGVGKYEQIRGRLPASSLQHIRYVGPKMEEKLIAAGVRTIAQLIARARRITTPEGLKRFLKTTVGLDGRSYNSILVFLDSRGVDGLPACAGL